MQNDFFDLNRPQYVASPEVLLSALAWTSVQESASDTMPPGRIVFRRRSPGLEASYFETSPIKNPERMESLRQHLASSFDLLDPRQIDLAAKVVTAQLESQTRERAKSVGILPLSLTAGLMQDTAGVLGAPRPPSFSAILEQMYRMGATSPECDSAAGLLVKLYKSGNGSDGAMQWLEGCIEAMAPPTLLDLAINAAPPELGCDSVVPVWLEGVPTPFTWFHTAWTNLCTGGWYEAMPRRRWVDWATCVLRTAIGTGFLYEMSFYYRLGLQLTNTGDVAVAARSLVHPDRNLLRWDPNAPTSKRDLASTIVRLCHGGTACRARFLEWQSGGTFPRMVEYLATADGLERWLAEAREAIRKDPVLREERKIAIASPKSSTGKNIVETVSGAIVARSGISGWVDGYSMLRKRGSRYSVVDPGQDWLGVLASLGGVTAGNPSRVSNLLTDLSAIGLQPGYSTVVDYLERAGLARSSHDADDAIEIASAF